MANPLNTTAYRLNDGRLAVDVTENKTLAIEDQGYVQNVITDAVVVTLPATVVGYNYTVRNGGDSPTGYAAGVQLDGSAKVSVSPNSADLIAGIGFTAADDKDAINAKATSRVGDEISVAGNGTTGWNVTAASGVWTRE